MAWRDCRAFPLTWLTLLAVGLRSGICALGAFPPKLENVFASAAGLASSAGLL